MDWLDTVVKVIVLGMLVWSLKNFITERTKKVKPEDVTVNLELMEKYCKGKREESEMKQATSLAHAVELLEQSLSHGDEKFEEFKKSIENLTKEVSGVNTSVLLLRQKIDETNSTETPKTPP